MLQEPDGSVGMLLKARALLADPERWIKGTAYCLMANGHSAHCALGALEAFLLPACNNAGDYDSALDAYLRARQALHVAIPPAHPKIHQGIPGFNDYPDTTHADILALFDRAIAAEMAKVR